MDRSEHSLLIQAGETLGAETTIRALHHLSGQLLSNLGSRTTLGYHTLTMGEFVLKT